MQSDLQEECWRSAERWCTSISVAMTLEQVGQRSLQEFWGSSQCSLTSISARMGSGMLGLKVLQACWRSAQRWRTLEALLLRQRRRDLIAAEIEGH